MFTVRVEPGGGGVARNVYSCTRYAVAGDDPSRLTLNLVEDGGRESSVILENGGCAYVMNEHGQTVDIVRTTRAAARVGG